MRPYLSKAAASLFLVLHETPVFDPSYSDGVCDNKQIAGLPFCDSSLSLDTRVQDLLQRIPIEDAVGLMVNNASAVKSVGLPKYEWWNEALHGVARSPGVSWKNPTPFATSFPQVINVAASFNVTLFRELGSAISTEARAFYNSRTAGLTFWTPNINIYRDPRWGRGQETPGEDPFLNGEYAVNFVRALQGEAPEGSTEPNDSPFLKVSGCCKHFSSYSQEVPRHRNDAIVSKQDQIDTYFPAFEDCVSRGHVSSVMCSYNAVNGVPSCADKALLTDLVRGQWKFDGYITSDCEAVYDVLYEHHYTQTPERTCATTLSAGMDLNCGEFLTAHLPKAIEKGIVTKGMLYTALGNMFRVQMRLGMFEKGKQPFADLSVKDIDTPEHRALALEAARQSIVLLKNQDAILPLDPAAFAKKGGESLALIGPHLNASETFLGNYNGTPSFIDTPLESISKTAASVSYAFGCGVEGKKFPDFDKVEGIAAKASQVILFVGLDQSQEREEIDRSHVELPGHQHALIKRVLKAAFKPVILVLISGGSVNLAQYKNDPKVGAIFFAGYLGQSGGQAISDVLFGAYNPSGRLTQTFYDGEFTKQVSIYDYSMRPVEATGNPGRTYRFFTGKPVYAFGEGLTYTKFDLAWTTEPAASLSVEAATTPSPGTDSCAWSLKLSVTNSGNKAGENIVLGFVEPPQAGANGRPLKKLVAFQRTPLLAPAESHELSFCLDAKTFLLANEEGEWVTEAGKWILHFNDLHHEVTISA